jgi:hypothetical protein
MSHEPYTGRRVDYSPYWFLPRHDTFMNRTMNRARMGRRNIHPTRPKERLPGRLHSGLTRQDRWMA